MTATANALPSGAADAGESPTGPLEVWGRSSSSNVQKVLWCCDELGVSFRRYDIGREFGGNREPAYLQMNPNGLIPTIRDGEVVVWESNAILRYLAARYDGERLYPAALPLRAQVDQWLDWEASTLAPAIFPVFWGLIRTPPEQRDVKALAAAQERLIEIWRLADRQLAGRAYVAGDGLTIADIAMGNSVHRWFEFPIDRPDLPMLRSWYDRLGTYTGFREHIAKPLV